MLGKSYLTNAVTAEEEAAEQQHKVCVSKEQKIISVYKSKRISNYLLVPNVLSNHLVSINNGKSSDTWTHMHTVRLLHRGLVSVCVCVKVYLYIHFCVQVCVYACTR